MATYDEQRISDVLEGNPAYRDLYGALIGYCDAERSLEEAQQFCDAQRTSPMQVLGAAALVDVMVRAGALDLRIFVDGEPYEASLEELQADESVDETAEVSMTVQATEAGRAAAAAVADAHSPDRLLKSSPARAEGFRAVLSWCAADALSTREVQERLKAADLLETEAARGIDGLHASYFTGALESVGALAWNGKAWIATDKGRALIGR